MTSNNNSGSFLIIIQNPLPFMIESYFKSKVFKPQSKYTSCSLEIIYKNELPYKIIITLPSEETQKSFIKQFDGPSNFFEPDILYPLSIEPFTENLSDYKQKIAEEIKNESENLAEYKFDFPYESEYFLDYISQPEKVGLVYKNEEAKKKIVKTVKYLVTKFGKNLLQGNSILNISFPVYIFDKRTLHQVFCYEHRLAPYFLSKAAFCTGDKIERLKWVTCFLISFLHFTTIQIKPFNPLIGETFQCRIGDLRLYLEQTQNHPITANFYGVDDNKNYELYGYQITDANVNVNTVTATRLGKYFIKFKDGTIFRIRIPAAVLRGITMGERMFSYETKALVIDLTNKLSSVIEINPNPEKREGGKSKGFLGGVGGIFGFKKTQSRQNFPDYFIGDIINSQFLEVDEKGSNHVLSKGYKSLCKIEGEWTNNILFDDIEYWNINDDKSLGMFNTGYKCPSDGSLRTDLMCFEKDLPDQSQKEKERLENRQRQDRKLRADYAKKNTK